MITHIDWTKGYTPKKQAYILPSDIDSINVSYDKGVLVVSIGNERVVFQDISENYSVQLDRKEM